MENFRLNLTIKSDVLMCCSKNVPFKKISNLFVPYSQCKSENKEKQHNVKVSGQTNSMVLQ